VVAKLEQVMIVAYKATLLEGFPLILQTEGTLARLFEFMKITGLERDFHTALKKWVVKRAETLFDADTDSFAKIGSIFAFKEECDRIQQVVQAESTKLHLKLAFETFVNNSKYQSQYA